MNKKRIRKFLYAPRDKWRFWRMNRTVRAEFEQGKIAYAKEHGEKEPALHIEKLGVTPIDNASSIISFPHNYESLVSAIADDAKQRLVMAKNGQFKRSDRSNTKLYSGEEKTEELPEIKDRAVRNIYLKDAKTLKGVQELLDHLLPQIEENVYRSYVKTDYISYYRTLDCRYPETGATLWHSDNHFEGVIKLFIHMNDVTEANAPFEYLKHKKTGEPVHIKPSQPQKYYGGRVPFYVIDDYLAKGYENTRMLGKAGTMMLLDDKIIHRGNFAHKGHSRDVLMVQLSPSAKRVPYTDDSRTKSY